MLFTGSTAPSSHKVSLLFFTNVYKTEDPEESKFVSPTLKSFIRIKNIDFQMIKSLQELNKNTCRWSSITFSTPNYSVSLLKIETARTEFAIFISQSLQAVLQLNVIHRVSLLIIFEAFLAQSLVRELAVAAEEKKKSSSYRTVGSRSELLCR